MSGFFDDIISGFQKLFNFGGYSPPQNSPLAKPVQPTQWHFPQVNFPSVLTPQQVGGAFHFDLGSFHLGSSDSIPAFNTAPGGAAGNNAAIIRAAVIKATPFVKNQEGFRTKAYRNALTEPWTYGYGFTTTPSGAHVTQSSTITRGEADDFLYNQMVSRANSIVKLVNVPLTANQLAALISLQFNIGTGAFASSTVVRLLKQKNYKGAADHFLDWKRGNTANDLLSRRQTERSLFLA